MHKGRILFAFALLILFFISSYSLSQEEKFCTISSSSDNDLRDIYIKASQKVPLDYIYVNDGIQRNVFYEYPIASVDQIGEDSYTYNFNQKTYSFMFSNCKFQERALGKPEAQNDNPQESTDHSTSSQPTATQATQGTLPQCSDNKDNDNDDKIDFRADGTGDPGCSDLTDNDERDMCEALTEAKCKLDETCEQITKTIKGLLGSPLGKKVECKSKECLKNQKIEALGYCNNERAVDLGSLTYEVEKYNQPGEGAKIRSTYKRYYNLKSCSVTGELEISVADIKEPSGGRGFLGGLLG